MTGRSWRIGSIGGIPLRIDVSWVYIAVLLTYSLYIRFTHHPAVGSQGASVALAVFAAFLFFGSVLVHELAHAGMGRALEIPVAGITLVFWGGATEVRAEQRGPMAEFLVSAVGPLTSLVLGGVFWALTRATAGNVVSSAFGYVGWVNLMLAGLNALPGLPFDGGRALRAVVWRVTGNRRRATDVAAYLGIGIGIAIGAVGAMRVLQQDLGTGLWMLFIAMFLVQWAQRTRDQERLRERLATATAGDAMAPPPPALEAGLSLSDALDSHLRGNEEHRFLVVDGGRAVGVLDYEAAREIGMHDPLRPVREAARPLDDEAVVDAEEPLDRAADRLTSGASLLVLQGDVVAGLLTLGSIARWLDRRTEQAPA